MHFLLFAIAAVALGVSICSTRKERKAQKAAEDKVRREREEHDVLLRELEERRKSNERRKRMAFRFYCDMNSKEFAQVVSDSRKGIKRLVSISCAGPLVRGVVRSQSNLTEWRFWLDFNDWGRLTGSYWITSENNDSVIPKVVGDRISSSVILKIRSAEPHVSKSEDSFEEFVPCSSCRSWERAGSIFCSRCGRPLKGGAKDAPKGGHGDKSGCSETDDEALGITLMVVLAGLAIAALVLFSMLT